MQNFQPFDPDGYIPDTELALPATGECLQSLMALQIGSNILRKFGRLSVGKGASFDDMFAGNDQYVTVLTSELFHYHKNGIPGETAFYVDMLKKDDRGKCSPVEQGAICVNIVNDLTEDTRHVTTVEVKADGMFLPGGKSLNQNESANIYQTLVNTLDFLVGRDTAHANYDLRQFPAVTEKIGGIFVGQFVTPTLPAENSGGVMN